MRTLDLSYASFYPVRPLWRQHWVCGESEQKILGMYWQAAPDYFKFKMKYH